MKNQKLLLSSFVAFFAAVICIGCVMRIPLGPVPIVLQNMLCFLTAVLLGGFYGCLPTALFLVAGLIGIPVYSGGTSGIAVWLGPTGGFLPGYFLGALISGLIAKKPSIEEKKFSWKTMLRLCLAVTAGMIILYIPGVIHFTRWAIAADRVPADKSPFAYTMFACVIPYIPGDIIKIVIAVTVALKLRPVLAQYLYDGCSTDISTTLTNSTQTDTQNDSSEQA